jgi:steroid delta-isomerase-like uncharacterized protein
MNSLIKKGTLISLSAIIVAFVFFSGCQQQQKPDASQQLKPIVDKYIEGWNTGNFDSFSSIYDSNFVHHESLSPDTKGIAGYEKLISGFRSAYPDGKFVLADEIYSENKVAVRWVFTGTNTGPGEIPPTGKSVNTWGVSILHFANGKINEEWAAFDNQSFMQQLGYTIMPPKAPKKMK